MTTLLPPDTPVLLLCPEGKAGHEVICRGVAAALSETVASTPVRPRMPWSLVAPWGPADPATQFPQPFPKIALASGRVAAPALRLLAQRSGGSVFTVFLHDPRAHDRIAGPNVMSTLTSPHLLTPEKIAAARGAPDPRIACLEGPRFAILLGGPSSAYKYEPHDVAALAQAARSAAAAGYSVMVTPSRRTPAPLTRIVADALADLPVSRRFVWTGEGGNPYSAILSNADAILVTADSVNMVGEAAATGAPVHLIEPTGRSRKIAAFIAGMEAHGAVRRWRGVPESWSYTPLDATAEIAAEIARRYLLARA
jgi:mitochondrial fission protein ELM1